MATIREAYRQTVARLRDMGELDPTFAAEWMLREILHWRREQLFLAWEQTLSPAHEKQLQAYVERRIAGEPLQYIIGKQAFYGRDFRVTPAVLIPRPETEEVVSVVLRESRYLPHSPLHVVDVGTGSGAIAVTLALEEPSWQVTAIDLSMEALAVAQQNAEQHGVWERINWLQGDLLTPLFDAAVYPQVIVSNPPYIATGDYQALEPQVRNFEPRLALEAGKDGLVVYRRLHQQLQQWPQPCLVVLEIGYDQGEALVHLFSSLSDQKGVHLEQDLGGRDRIIWFTINSD
jgi:release factor glutamine methyltransferase